MEFKDPQINIKKIFENDFDFKERLTNPEKYLKEDDDTDEPILIEMVRKDYF